MLWVTEEGLARVCSGFHTLHGTVMMAEAALSALAHLHRRDRSSDQRALLPWTDLDEVETILHFAAVLDALRLWRGNWSAHP
jgi:hypothetical protein